jgi:hypothetical protein
MCSGANVEMVKSLGADKVIDYTKEDFTKNGKTYDLIFDIVGATTFDRCQNSLNPQGVFLQNIMGLTGMVRILWTSITGGKKLEGGVAMENLERLNFIMELAAAGKLRHMPAGTLRHANIIAAQQKSFECAVGWITHYTIGVAFALVFVVLTSGDWLARPTLLPALLYGTGTVVFPFFIMQPSLGLGIAASRTPNQRRPG